jgi:hypothetical protein
MERDAKSPKPKWRVPPFGSDPPAPDCPKIANASQDGRSERTSVRGMTPEPPSRLRRSARVGGVDAFVQRAEETLLATSIDLERMSWVYETYINEDTEILSAQMQAAAIATKHRIAKESRRLDGVPASRESKRKLQLLRLTSNLMAPADPKENA